MKESEISAREELWIIIKLAVIASGSFIFFCLVIYGLYWGFLKDDDDEKENISKENHESQLIISDSELTRNIFADKRTVLHSQFQPVITTSNNWFLIRFEEVK